MGDLIGRLARADIIDIQVDWQYVDRAFLEYRGMA